MLYSTAKLSSSEWATYCRRHLLCVIDLSGFSTQNGIMPVDPPSPRSSVSVLMITALAFHMVSGEAASLLLRQVLQVSVIFLLAACSLGDKRKVIKSWRSPKGPSPNSFEVLSFFKGFFEFKTGRTGICPSAVMPIKE